MGVFRKTNDGEGAVFAQVKANRSSSSIAQVTGIAFPAQILTKQECIEQFATSENVVLLYNAYTEHGLYPTVSARCFAEAVKLVQNGTKEVIVYNGYFGATPTVLRVQCVG